MRLAQQYDPQQKPRLPECALVDALTEHLVQLGVENAFGVSGGAIALLFDSVAESSIQLHHFRHESGAAFAATEAYFASGKPSLVFSTTGPGALNALTGITAAKWEGAKVIWISGATSAAQRGRWATQETSSYTLPQDALYSRGPIFDFAVRMEHPAEFPEIARRLASGLARPGGFVAHLCLPMGIQASRLEAIQAPRPVSAVPSVAEQDIEYCANLLKNESFAIWAGFGARQASDAVRTLVDRTGAKIFCSPRAKGIVSEDHPHYLGVTGIGGHETVTDYMIRERPDWVLVLGSRLGEATSFWDSDMEPRRGFLHVDLDPEVPGTAYPETYTIGIQAEIGLFLEALLEHIPEEPRKVRRMTARRHENTIPPISTRKDGNVRPKVLMQVLQREVVLKSDAIVLAECGNSFAWCNHHLRFHEPNRYRVSTLFGSMGHCVAGVVGAAMASEKKAVAVVGDGSMLMNSEISTAVQYGAKAVWVVLNDSGYGMCRDGHGMLGLNDSDMNFPQVDFVALAKSMGADGKRVTEEKEVWRAVRDAMASDKPYVLDVHIDVNEASPLLKRFESLIKQGSSKHVSGWDK